MTNLDITSSSRLGMKSTPYSIMMRVRKRELFICRDFYKCFYRSNPLIECNAGI